MKITWIGHSCFKIEENGYSIVIDPYQAGSVPGLDPIGLTADQVLCSHEHGDHNAREEVALSGRSEEESPFVVETIQTYHDEVFGKKRGNNRIFIIRAGEQRIAHLGDLGCVLTEEEKERLRNLDVIMIPVGGYYTIDGRQAAELIEELKPCTTIPMHYRDDSAGFGFAEIDTVQGFTKFMKNIKVTGASEFDTKKAADSQVVVLHPMRSTLA